MIQSSLPNTDRIRIRTCLLSFALPSNIVMHDIDNAVHMKSPDTNESLAPLPGSEVPFVDDNFTHELDQGQSYFENDPFWSFTGQQAEASAVAGDEWTSKDGIGPVLPPDSRLFTKASSSCGTSNSLADSRGPALGPSAPKLIDVYGERSASSALVDLGAQPLAAERAHKDSGQVTQTLESHSEEASAIDCDGKMHALLNQFRCRDELRSRTRNQCESCKKNMWQSLFDGQKCEDELHSLHQRIAELHIGQKLKDGGYDPSSEVEGHHIYAWIRGREISRRGEKEAVRLFTTLENQLQERIVAKL